ncbi:MAG TPA: hypothetical protein VD884_21075 [Ohtaekwangia sp.]|nr:hypothetical protein [Ohtaekwangia sp.]
MLIEEKKLSHWINNFYGYGSWNAKFWFISYEESGGDVPEQVAEQINYFHKVHIQNTSATLCDLRDMYRQLDARWYGPKAATFARLFEYRFGTDAIQNNIWKNLIAFVHGYKNEDVYDVLDYQKHSFASTSHCQEALIRLFPLPSPHNHAWYYSWLDMPQLNFIKTRDAYQEHVYNDRIRNILTNIPIHKPDVVLMYGMDNINKLKNSIQSCFENVRFQMVKGTKLETPQHHRADLNGTTMLITTQIPTLRHNRIESGFNWIEFGRKIKSNLPQ